MQEIKINKELAHGMMGRVYLGKYKKRDVVIKVSKIIPKFMKPLTGDVWKELEFYTTFAKKHFALHTIHYEIIYNCNEPIIDGVKYKHPARNDVIARMPPKWKKIHEDLQASQMCLINIMPIITGKNLKYYFNRVMKNSMRLIGFTKKQYYSWYVDLLKQLQLLHKNGYSHNDIHSGNIIISNKSAILIDFGLVDSKKWSGNKFSIERDCDHMYYLTHLMNHFEEYARLNKKYGNKFPIGHKEYEKDLKKFLKTPEGSQVLALCKFVPSARQRKNIAFDMAEMLMPDFMKNLCVEHKYTNEIKFKELWLIEFEDVLFLLNNIYSPGGISAVIKHFEKKLI